MSSSFILESFERVGPLMSPSEVADEVAQQRGAPRVVKRLRGESVVTLMAGRILDDDGEIRRGAADDVLGWLVGGKLPSYVQCPARRELYRIPSSYWTMRSGAENPWSVLDELAPCPWAPGYDESMAEQPVYVGKQDAVALLASVLVKAGGGNGTKPKLSLVQTLPHTTKVPRVPQDKLREWIAAQVEADKGQTETTASAAQAFLGLQVPGREALRQMYREEYTRLKRTELRTGPRRA